MAKGQSTDAKREAAKTANKTIRNKNRGKGGETADWASIKPEVILEVIASVTSRNCALQFGYTRDGGAYCLRIVGDGDAYNEYIRPTEDVELYINGITEDFKL